MQFNQIKETCLYVKDLQQTREFYEGKLGLPVISLVENRHVFFRAGTSVLLCFNAEVTAQDASLPQHWGQGQLHLAFEAAPGEYETWKKRLSQHNIAIEHEQMWSQGRHSCYFRDPEGHCLEIVEPGIWD